MKTDIENEVNKKKDLKKYNTTTGFEITTYGITPEHHWAMWSVGDNGVKVQYKLAHLRYTPS